MPDIDYLIEVCEDNRVKTNALALPELIEAAQDVAYYMAMIDAAEDDPFEDPQTQDAIMQYFRGQLSETLKRYQSLVNEHL